MKTKVGIGIALGAVIAVANLTFGLMKLNDPTQVAHPAEFRTSVTRKATRSPITRVTSEPSETEDSSSQFTAAPVTPTLDNDAPVQIDNRPEITHLDKVPPTSVTGIRLESNTAETFTLVWNPSKDESGVRGYQVFVDREFIAEVATPEVELPWNFDTASQLVQINAVDTHGNRSGWSAIVVMTLPQPTPTPEETPTPTPTPTPDASEEPTPVDDEPSDEPTEPDEESPEPGEESPKPSGDPENQKRKSFSDDS